MRVWLVQRASLNDISDAEVTGYDSAFTNQITAKTEFEQYTHGSLVYSCENLALYEKYTHKLKSHTGDKLYAFCFPHQKDELFDVLTKMAKGKKRTTENHFLAEMLGDPAKVPGYLRHIDLWWDIENNWFACIGEKAMNRLQLALRILQEKWIASGKIKGKP